MSDLYPVLATLGMLSVVLTGVGFLVRHQMRKQDAAAEAWEAARERLGLADAGLSETSGAFDYTERGMAGEFDGVDVMLRVVHAPTDTAKYRTEGTAKLGHRLPFQVSGRGLFTVGGLPTGDAAFDAVYHVKAKDGVAVGLTPSVRAAFLALRSCSSDFEFDGETLKFRESGDWEDASRAEAALKAMAQAIHALRGSPTAETARVPASEPVAGSGVTLPEFNAHPDGGEQEGSDAEAANERDVASEHRHEVAQSWK